MHITPFCHPPNLLCSGTVTKVVYMKVPVGTLGFLELTAANKSKWSETYEPQHDKTNNMSVRPAKTQISLGIRPVWSESLLSSLRKLGSLATH